MRARRGPTRAGTRLLAAALLLGLGACGAPGTSQSPPADGGPASAPASGSTSSPAPPPPTCAERTLAALSPGEQVGQLLMMGVPVTDPVAGAGALSGVGVGGLFLYGRSTAAAETVGAAVAQLQAASAVPLEIAVDQEGGLVQTLQGPGFDRVPSALEQGRLDSAALRSATAGWAAQLRGAGITMDLAPVADTVPAGGAAANPPVGAVDRQFGSDPAAVAAAVTTVVRALQEAGVVATAKHFPGLGRVRVNTDTGTGATDPQTRSDDPFLQPFTAAVDAGVAAVMVSSATYPQLDPDHLAVFSPVVVGLLRNQLHFGGVVISDDLGTAAALSGTPVGARAVDAVAAGVDVVLDKDPGHAVPMAQALADRAAADPAFADRVRESAGRVLALKERFGLLSC